MLCSAVCSNASTLTVGQGKSYKTVSGAVADAGDGDTIKVFPGRYLDCAVIAANHLTLEGVGDPSSVAITDKICQGKAILVTTGHDITIRNLTLARARAPDGNGAGIRAEGGNLSIDGVQFVNNQDGILVADNPSAVVSIRHSLFEKDGVCLDACAHAIYAGHIAELDVDGTLFRDTRDGHDIKSRAARTVVTNSDMGDGATGTSSYLIELPNGGALVARHDLFEKGPKTGNQSAAISIGAEGVSQDTPELTIEENQFTNDGAYRTAFVNNLTATPATLRSNRLIGNIVPLKGDGTTQ